MVAASLRERLIKIDAKVISHGRYITFQIAEVAVSRQMFADILSATVHLSLFCSASHCIEPGCHMVWAGCGWRRCSAASVSLW